MTTFNLLVDQSMTTFPKKYDHTIENDIYQMWEKSGCFSPEKVREMRGVDPKEQFTISMPPPNVTGVLHTGHALMLAIEDTMARFHRMKGHDTLWVPGTDHAGIATQVVVEKQLAAKKIKRTDL